MISRWLPSTCVWYVLVTVVNVHNNRNVNNRNGVSFGCGSCVAYKCQFAPSLSLLFKCHRLISQVIIVMTLTFITPCFSSSGASCR
ncbi:uncharacterized protein CANTADRAFT_94167 [Suhomyces tanzawaensis NRRL Y-17324]|uniref:Secreted protein n=1 Tax=Suhomyces tanzawaensis NRRL Y-17324 TaxID=984487 RepID=A0A1E4SNC9_9ASCO|nr:uncharacterized protein CANTADRAFT_94167 [Suhomyces tanzawaensis NRRL Y-17324]ODV81013.1 hypothetical protein CANTADRAFT_94167 [Suhomyces tanzawaensis NRRL Y-17324]